MWLKPGNVAIRRPRARTGAKDHQPLLSRPIPPGLHRDKCTGRRPIFFGNICAVSLLGVCMNGPNEPTMPDEPRCPQCGAPLGAGALAGLCPACLLRQGASGDTVSEGTTRHPFEPPTITIVPLGSARESRSDPRSSTTHHAFPFSFGVGGSRPPPARMQFPGAER
jgi:hypothetical protein